MSEQNNNIFDEQLPETEQTRDPVQTAQSYIPPKPPEEKRSKKPLVLGAVVAVVIVAVVIALCSGMLRGSPTEQVFRAAGNTIESLGKNPALATLTNALTDGSLELSADLEELSELTGLYVEGELSAKLYTNIAKQALGLEARAEVEDMDPLDLQLVLQDQEIALSSKGLLGKTAYGVDIGKAADRFENSVFGPEGEYSLGIDSIEELTDRIGSGDQLQKDTKALVDEALKVLIKSVEEHAVIKEDSDELDFNGKTVATRVVSMEFGGADVYAIAEDLLDWAAESDKLEAFLKDNIGYFGGVGVDAYGDIVEIDPEERVEVFYEQLESVREELEYAAEDMRESEDAVELEFHISKSGKYLVAAEILLDDEDAEDLEIELMMGPSLKELRELSLNVDDGWDKIKLSYTVDEDDNGYTGRFKARENGETICHAKLQLDKEKGEFEAELTDDWGETYYAEGELYEEGKHTILVLDSLTAQGYTTRLGLTLTMTPGEAVPSLPKYEDILLLDEDAFEELIEELDDAFEEWDYVFGY